VRTVPGAGLIIANAGEASIERVLARGCWTPVEKFPDPAGWSLIHDAKEAATEIAFQGKVQGVLSWDLLGTHNQHNALAAIAAARHVGVTPAHAIGALQEFRNVKRRMEIRAVINGITIYDDFAHHPTAIATTLQGLRAKLGAESHQRIIAVLEPRSNTMRMGVHRDTLAPALTGADSVILYEPANLGWDLSAIAAQIGPKARVFHSTATIADYLAKETRAGDHVLIMSNGGFDGLHEQLIKTLQARD